MSRRDKHAEAVQPAKGEIRNLKSLSGYLKPYRWQIAAAFFAMAFTSSAVLGMGAGLRFLVDEGLSKSNHGLLDEAFELLLGVTVLLALTSFARYYLVSWIGERVVADIRRAVFAHTLKMEVAFFEVTRTGELLSRITTDTTLLQTVIGSSVSVAVRNSLLFVGGFALLLFTSAALTSYVFLMMPLVVVPIIILGKRVRVLSRDTQHKVAGISAEAEETFTAIRSIQAMALEEHRTTAFNTQVDVAMRAALARIRLRAFLTALVIMLIFGAIVTVLWLGGKDVIAGRITPGDLSAFIFYSVVVAGAVGAISEVIADLQRAAGATERLMELLGMEPAIAVPANPQPIPALKTATIAFKQVNFNYPSRPEQAALSDVSFEMAPGSTLALVGPSGAGKTTVLQLLLRFYDPSSGSIEVAGNKLSTFDPQAWRAGIGVVPQEPVIFSETAMENIRCGRPEATDDEVIEAARQAAALDFLQALPEGLNTYLGEKGVQLSGGQRQRISIARALVRNPGLLLLDEATSALDAENERIVQQAIEGLMKDRTTLVIAHRLSTVTKADRILLINEGRIEAAGTHEELLKKSPLYARLVALQLHQAA